MDPCSSRTIRRIRFTGSAIVSNNVAGAAMSDSTIHLLRELIAIDSVNPALVPGAAGEHEITELIVNQLQRSGMDVVIQPVTGDRANVIGIIEGGRPGPTLMLCGHTDTVGVAGMQAPFDPIEKDGRIYGRGSQDMKGGLAAMMAAAIHFAA